MPEFLKDMERKRRQAEEDLSNNIKDAEVLSQSETKWETWFTNEHILSLLYGFFRD